MVSNDKPDKFQPHMSTSTVQSLLLTKPELTSYGVKQRLWISIEVQNYTVMYLGPPFYTQIWIPSAQFHGKQ